MRSLQTILGAAVVVALGSTAAHAQTNSLNAFSAATPMPAGGGAGGYVVGPVMPGSGGTYSYAQQPGGLPGASPYAYYSMNYFTNTPMTRPYGNGAGYYNSAYRGYAQPVSPYAPGAYTTRPLSPITRQPYAAANRSYYANRPANNLVPTRRGGPLRRLFGR